MASDDFNRANESPLTGAWAGVGIGNINLASNAIKTASAGNDSGAKYTPSSVASARFRISTVGDSDGGPALWAPGTALGYIVTAGNGADIAVYRMDGPGSFTELNHASGTYALNSQIRLRRSGGNLIVSKDGADVVTGTDSTYLSVTPGWFGFGTVEADDFTDDAAADTLFGQALT